MRYDCDVLIIGAGIIGLATAYALTRAAPGRHVVVLEKESGPARHQSGRNSGVVHSGVYYRPGSLKARFATRGAAELAAFCAQQGLPHATTGKLIVATRQDELPRLHALAQRGRAHGIPVRELGPSQVAAYEPAVRALGAVHVASTGVCDYPAVADRLAALAEDAGASIRYAAPALAVGRRADAVAVRVGESVAPGRRRGGQVFRARVLVNCAGLHCDQVARSAGHRTQVRIIPFRGEFFRVAPGRSHLVRGLVYPVPDPAFPFLGVHLTRGVDGTVHVGPNAVPALAREGYSWSAVRPRDLAGVLGHRGSWRLAGRHYRHGAGELRRSASKRAFSRAVRQLLPALQPADLIPAPAGVRAQAVLPDGRLADDFLIAESPRMVHLLNAPSPAATASLPIGREVARRALAALERA